MYRYLQDNHRLNVLAPTFYHYLKKDGGSREKYFNTNRNKNGRKILDYLGEGGLADICTNTKALTDISTEFVLELVTKIIEQVDADFCDSKLRKDMNLLVQQKYAKRTVLVPMGEIQFARTVYKSKETDEYVYPIDAIIGLEERERLSKELCARLIQGAADRSYEKSSKDYASGKVTRQTVKNKI